MPSPGLWALQRLHRRLHHRFPYRCDAGQSLGEIPVIDQGNCTYAIQTTSGFFVGIFKDPNGYMLLTTRRDGAATANEKFQLVVYGLASPPVLR